MRRSSPNSLVENERRLLVALRRLDGRSWSRPILDEADALRTDDRRTGPATLLRAMPLFERRGWVTNFEEGDRRYYELTEAGHAVAAALEEALHFQAESERAEAVVAKLTGA